MDLKVKTSFSKARIESFYRFHITKVSNIKFIERGIIIVLLIVSILGYYPFYNLYVMIIPIIIIIVILLTLPYRVNKSVNKMFNSTPLDIVPYTVLLTDNSITYIHEKETSVIKWFDVYKICEIDVCFYIYINISSVIIIPKHLLKLNEKDSLRNFLISTGKYKKYKFHSSFDKEGVV